MLIEVFGSLEWKRKRESAIEGLLFAMTIVVSRLPQKNMDDIS